MALKQALTDVDAVVDDGSGAARPTDDVSRPPDHPIGLTVAYQERTLPTTPM